jgi:hypothetical protein
MFLFPRRYVAAQRMGQARAPKTKKGTIVILQPFGGRVDNNEPCFAL